AAGTPRRRSPNATLSHTLSQKKLASCWKTAPMPSGTRPPSGLPSSVAVPAVAVDSPDSTSSRVDLPQPDGPTTLNSSPAAMSRSTGPSACTSGCPSWPGKILVTPRRLIWPLAAMARPAFDEAQQRVEGRREAEQQKRDRQDVDHAMHVHGADQREAEPGGGRKQLADQRTEQGQRHANADAGEDFRQGRRRHDGGGGRQRGEPHDQRDAPIHRRDVAHRIHGEDRDRKDAMDHAESDL